MVRWQHIKSEGKEDEALQCSPVGLLRRRAPPPIGPGSGRSLGRRWRQLPGGTPSPQAQPATRETREPQTFLLDAENPSAWRCPREGRECTIRAGVAPCPPSRLAAPQGDQGPARGDGGGKAGLRLLYPIDSCHAQEPKSLLVRKLHPEKKLLVTSLSPPRLRAVRPWICRGSPPREAWRTFGSKEDTTLGCVPLVSSSP